MNQSHNDLHKQTKPLARRSAVSMYSSYSKYLPSESEWWCSENRMSEIICYFLIISQLLCSQVQINTPILLHNPVGRHCIVRFVVKAALHVTLVYCMNSTRTTFFTALLYYNQLSNIATSRYITQSAQALYDMKRLCRLSRKTVLLLSTRTARVKTNVSSVQ